MGKYSLVPVEVPRVKTRFRTITTKLPVPESLPIFRSLEESESITMMGQPPVVWHRAEGFQIWDRWGNRWLDWTSGVVVSNAGHGRKEIRRALREVVDHGLLMSYCFVHEQRAELTKLLCSLSPDPVGYRVFLLSTGSEAVENAIKLARTWALDKYGPRKRVIVSFENAFHGRTLGAQLAGGMQHQKKWIQGEGSTFVQVPFPEGYYCQNTSFDLFLETLARKGVAPEDIAGMITESFQGAGVNFFPLEYVRKLDAFCKENAIITIFDEVQAGFGRSGKMFAYEHYGVKPDLIVCGKGITSSLPLSAVIGRTDLMSQYPAGSSTSTHSASPLPVAAALQSIKLIRDENMVENSRRLGEMLERELLRIQGRFPQAIGCVHVRGLAGGVLISRKGTREPDPETAFQISEACFQKGLLMTAPVGTYGECHKVAPALMISEDALNESLQVYEEACAQILG